MLRAVAPPRAGGDFDRGRRQQRVLLSLREQMNAQAIVANLPELVERAQGLGQDRHPDRQLPKLLAPRGERRHPRHPLVRVRAALLRDGVPRTRPAATSSRPTSSRIRAAGPRGVQVSPELLAQRERLAAEAAAVWVFNASGTGRAPTRVADYLGYHGLDASAPHKRLAEPAREDDDHVYNGAEADAAGDDHVPREAVRDDGHDRDGPGGRGVDIVITLGQDAPDLEVEPLG